MKKVLIIVLALICFHSLVSAKTYNFSDAWGKPGFNLINQDFAGVEVVYSIPKMTLGDVVVNNENFTQIGIPGIFLPRNEGSPNLPGNGKLIAVPNGATAKVTILSSETEVISNVNIAPAPRIVAETEDSPPELKKDAAIYSQDAYFPASPVFVSAPSKTRGVNYVKLGITPFQYNPITKELLVYKNLRVRVEFQGGTGYFGEDRLRSRYWESILQNNLFNYASLPKMDFSRQPGLITDTEDVEYLIVTIDDSVFIAWADTIKQWRTLQGISTGIATLTDIGSSDTSAIEEYIDDALDEWDPAPVAVLILGDHTDALFSGIDSKRRDCEGEVLSWNAASDNGYSLGTGGHELTFLPSIAMARICARDSTDLRKSISKMLDYERNPPTDEDFYDKPLFSGGWWNQRWYILSSEICFGFMENELGKNPLREYSIYSGTPGNSWSIAANTENVVDYFGEDGLEYVPDTSGYLDDWEGSAAGINNAINDGAFLVMNRDHGQKDHWGEPEYWASNLYNLTNDEYPFVLSINCLIGEFDFRWSCFAEIFHSVTHGALGVTASSDTSWSFCNDVYTWGWFDSMWPDFDPDRQDDSCDVFGGADLRPCLANVNAKYYLHAIGPDSFGTVNSRMNDTYYLYHHFGDAFMTIYSEVPESLTVSHANAMVPNSGSFSVTANDGSLIALTVDGEIIGVDEGTGSPVSISIEQQSAGETVTITVTMANYYRYEEDITTSGLTGNVYNGSGGPLLAANSPYYLLGDITVPQAESLTVNAGVEVIFGDGDMITADGVLKADGTQVNPISFLDDANETKKILKGDFILKNGGECKVP